MTVKVIGSRIMKTYDKIRQWYVIIIQVHQGLFKLLDI